MARQFTDIRAKKAQAYLLYAFGHEKYIKGSAQMLLDIEIKTERPEELKEEAKNRIVSMMVIKPEKYMNHKLHLLNQSARLLFDRYYFNAPIDKVPNPDRCTNKKMVYYPLRTANRMHTIGLIALYDYLPKEFK